MVPTVADRRGARRTVDRPAGAREDAARRLPAPDRPGRFRHATRWLLTGPIGLALLVLGVYAYFTLDPIDLRDPRQVQKGTSITLLDREGRPFAGVGDARGEWLKLEAMSPWLPSAIVAVEDRRFYDHLGIDPIGVARALWRNVAAGGVVEGGSTITQQLAKVAFLTPERSLTRKAQEAVYALWLEMRFDKAEILAAYLNRVYFGAGAYGVDGASRRYFGKSARRLTLPEAAMLAGLVKAPSTYAPTRDLKRAQARAAVVVTAMAESGAIDAAQARAALAAPARLAGGEAGGGGRYFADWVSADAQAIAGEDAVDLRVRTTLDTRMQAVAERTVRTMLDDGGGASRVGQAALVAMTPSGEVLALVGGRSYADSQYNRATQARRQPGSAFKLFVYLAALEAGYDADDTVSGAPVAVDGWRPANFDGEYPSDLTLGSSFARSVNTATVRVAEAVGRERAIDVARRLGVTSELRDTPSLSLGASGVSLLEMTAAYAALADGGRLVWPTGFTVVDDLSNEEVYRNHPAEDQVLDPEVTGEMVAMLREAVTRGTGRAARPADGRPVAGKTGTSSDHRDAWFVGFTGDLVVGVWVGNDDGRPMRGVTGGHLPARMFGRFVSDALKGTPAMTLAEAPVPEAKPSRWLRVAGGVRVPEVSIDEARRAVGDAIGTVWGWFER